MAEEGTAVLLQLYSPKAVLDVSWMISTCVSSLTVCEVLGAAIDESTDVPHAFMFWH